MKFKIDKLDIYIRSIYILLLSVSFMLREKMSFIYTILMFIVIVDLIYIFIKTYRENNYDFKLIGLIFLFLFTHFITAVLNYENNLFKNLMEIPFMFSYIFIFLIYYKSNIDKLFTIYAYFIEIISFIVSTITFLIISSRIVIIFKAKNNHEYFWGVFKERVWPLLNPNTMVIICYISIVLALVLINRNKLKKNLFLKFNIILQFIFLLLQQSRAGFLSFFIMGVLYILYVYEKDISIYKKIINIKLFLLIFISLIFVVNLGVNSILNSDLYKVNTIVKLNKYIDKKKNITEKKQVVVSKKNDNAKYDIDIKKKEVKTDRVRVSFNDFTTNGRSNIWRIAIKMTSNKLFFGYGLKNVEQNYKKFYSKDVVKESLSNLNFHNIFISVLVVGGITNLIIFTLIICYLSYKFILYLKHGKEYDIKLIILLFFGIMLCQLFESIVLYTVSFVSVLFWSIVGYIMYSINDK